jgi:predicted Zn-dependent protease|tara:strand:- start:2013 stop:2363 length:351 start_codon:yes stop_codon:yes gene_type:complete
LTYLSRLVPPSKANPYLFQELGVMAMERGRTNEAREHFKEGTKTDAGAQSAVLWQAWAMLETREPLGGETARKLFQKGTCCISQFPIPDTVCPYKTDTFLFRKKPSTWIPGTSTCI